MRDDLSLASKSPRPNEFGTFLLKVEEADASDGYQHFFRVQQLWGLTKRKQPFYNWFTKLFPGFLHLLCILMLRRVCTAASPFCSRGRTM